MNLDDWRSRINNLDDEILKLLNQRGTAALQIGELKRQQDLPYFSPEREAQVLDRLVALNDGPLGPDAIRVIWREILSASLALEHPLPVAYLGPPGTFTHQAATRRFGSSAQLPAGTHHRRDLRRGGARARRVRGGAGGELHRGRGQRDPRSPDRLRRDDHRRDDPRHLAAPHLARHRPRGGEGGLLAPAGPRPVPGVARRAPAGGDDRGDRVDLGGGGAGARRRHGGRRRLRHGRCRARGADPATPHRGQPVQLDPLPRHRAARRCRPPGGTRRRSSSR